MANTNSHTNTKSGAKLWTRILCIVLAVLMVGGGLTALISWIIGLF